MFTRTSLMFPLWFKVGTEQRSLTISGNNLECLILHKNGSYAFATIDQIYSDHLYSLRIFRLRISTSLRPFHNNGYFVNLHCRFTDVHLLFEELPPKKNQGMVAHSSVGFFDIS